MNIDISANINMDMKIDTNINTNVSTTTDKNGMTITDANIKINIAGSIVWFVHLVIRYASRLNTSRSRPVSSTAWWKGLLITYRVSSRETIDTLKHRCTLYRNRA